MAQIFSLKMWLIKNYCIHRALLQYKFLKGMISEGKYKQSKVTMRITLLGTYNKSLTNEIPAARGKNAYSSYNDKV